MEIVYAKTNREADPDVPVESHLLLLPSAWSNLPLFNKEDHVSPPLMYDTS
jgi:hypothetical protein